MNKRAADIQDLLAEFGVQLESPEAYEEIAERVTAPEPAKQTHPRTERERFGIDTLSISFDGEASETFARIISNFHGYCVRVTPKEEISDPFDAILIGGDDSEWHDAVTVADVDSDSCLIPGTERSLRVSDVYVY